METLKTYEVALRTPTATRKLMETNDLNSARETFEELKGWYKGECEIVLHEKFWTLQLVTPLNTCSVNSECDHDWEEIGDGKKQCTYGNCQNVALT